MTSYLTTYVPTSLLLLWQVLAGDVVMSHIGGETGQTGRLETLTVIVRQSSDNIAPALIDVPLSIAPLDNSPPQLVIGSHLIAEVDTPVSLDLDVISAQDLDTSPQRLTFFVTQTPVWGRLEKRSLPMIRRGLSLCVTVDQFSVIHKLFSERS